MTAQRDEANRLALKNLTQAEPVLVDVQRASDVVPGMTRHTILTSGPALAWSEITGIQRQAIVHAVLYEKLATTTAEAEALLDAGDVRVEPTQPHGCVGVSTGVYTASMPVYVVENRTGGNRAFCHMLEGNPPRLFVNGAWGDDVVERLRFVDQVLAPTLAEVIRRSGGIPLKPIMRRAIPMGDELHTRNDAATLLFTSTILPVLLDIVGERQDEVRSTIQFLQATPFSFMRMGVAAAKAALDAAHGIEGSSMVTGMIHSTKEFAIRVSGLGDRWFCGPHPEFQGKFFWGSSKEDVGWAGGESSVMETVGLGGFAQAAAFALPFRGPVDQMIERNLRMYDITLGENPEFKIPYFDRGLPVGIDIFKVIETGIRPVLNAVVIRRDGEGVAGVGPLVTAIEPFQAAAAAYTERYG
ncbi:MAG TPA: DUF1116 domain-containing protein [Kofleriaceae bacterium]|nr:DUF1116 domain-containing protein [Kofleriaceae bacterium]